MTQQSCFGIYVNPKEMKSGFQRDVYPLMFIPELLTTAQCFTGSLAHTYLSIPRVLLPALLSWSAHPTFQLSNFTRPYICIPVFSLRRLIDIRVQFNLPVQTCILWPTIWFLNFKPLWKDIAWYTMLKWKAKYLQNRDLFSEMDGH